MRRIARRQQFTFQFITTADNIDQAVKRTRVERGTRLSPRLLETPPIGARYGRLTVASSEIQKDAHGRAYWCFICECGQSCKTEAAKVVKRKIRTCGCLKREAASATNRKFADPLLKYKRAIVASYRKHAKNLGFVFELSDEQFYELMLQPCFYCGRSGVGLVRRKYGTFRYNGVDRMDSSNGYVVENCVACCKVCNIMKQSLTVLEFIEHLRAVAAHFGKESK